MQAVSDMPVTSIEDRTYLRSYQAPGVARLFVHSQLLVWSLPRLVDTAELVVSELVTNAVEYGVGSIIGVRLECSGGSVMIRVKDENGTTAPKVPRLPADMLDENGRGLALVVAVAEHWGWYRTAEGNKVLWAMITRPM